MSDAFIACRLDDPDEKTADAMTTIKSRRMGSVERSRVPRLHIETTAPGRRRAYRSLHPDLVAIPISSNPVALPAPRGVEFPRHNRWAAPQCSNDFCCDMQSNPLVSVDLRPLYACNA